MMLLRLCVLCLVAVVCAGRTLRTHDQETLVAADSSKASSSSADASGSKVGAPKFLIKSHVMGHENAVLYLERGVPLPQPEGLYVVETAKTTFPGIDERFDRKITPNVAFFDPKEWRTGEGRDWRYDPEKGDGKVKFVTKARIAKLKQRMAGNHDTTDAVVTNPQYGVMALNDCARWSQFLMHLLDYKGFKGSITSDMDPNGDGISPEDLKALQFKDGARLPAIMDAFNIKYPVGHHGITVVLSEAWGFITLEAHASKTLFMPYFTYYKSMEDFVLQNYPQRVIDDPKSKVYLIYPKCANTGEGVLDGYCTVKQAKINAPFMDGLIASVVDSDRASADEILFDAVQTPITRLDPSSHEMTDGTDGKITMVGGHMSSTFLPAWWVAE